LLALTAVETLIALLLEMYRPAGSKAKLNARFTRAGLSGCWASPKASSRLLPRRLIINLVSKYPKRGSTVCSWKKALAVLVCLQIAVLFLSTCVVFIEAGEQGLLERCGRPVLPPLNAGIHFKLPWPLDHVYRFRTQQIQSFEIGTTPDAEKKEGPIVLWTVAHSKEDNFLVANREPASAELTDTNNHAVGNPTGDQYPDHWPLAAHPPAQRHVGHQRRDGKEQHRNTYASERKPLRSMDSNEFDGCCARSMTSIAPCANA